jgi:hypothetical protein
MFYRRSFMHIYNLPIRGRKKIVKLLVDNFTSITPNLFIKPFFRNFLLNGRKSFEFHTKYSVNSNTYLTSLRANKKQQSTDLLKIDNICKDLDKIKL